MVAKTEEKDSKTSSGLNYVPWRKALTAATFAIPVAGLILGAVVGAITCGNYRKNNITESPDPNNGPDKSNNKEDKKEGEKERKEESERVQPSRLEKLSSQASTIAKRIGVVAIGFLVGGPIGGIIATGLMIVDGISGGKLIQGAEKALDAGYDVLIWAKDKALDAGKWAVDKMKGSEKEVEDKGEPSTPEKGEGKMEKPTEEKAASNAKEGSSEEQLTNKPIVGEQTAKLAQGRESAGQEQSAGIFFSI